MFTLKTIGRLQVLTTALDVARELDEQQEHGQAAATLDAAINTSNGDWDGESEDELLAYQALVQQCSEEAQRQLWREARLNAYLNC